MDLWCPLINLFQMQTPILKSVPHRNMDYADKQKKKKREY